MSVLDQYIILHWISAHFYQVDGIIEDAHGKYNHHEDEYDAFCGNIQTVQSLSKRGKGQKNQNLKINYAISLFLIGISKILVGLRVVSYRISLDIITNETKMFQCP